jgi:hypothetical protein
MSSNRQPIDNLFQEGLANFEANPPEIVWENIKTEVTSKNRRRRLLAFWLPTALVVSTLAWYSKPTMQNHLNNNTINKQKNVILIEKNQKISNPTVTIFEKNFVNSTPKSIVEKQNTKALLPTKSEPQNNINKVQNNDLMLGNEILNVKNIVQETPHEIITVAKIEALNFKNIIFQKDISILKNKTGSDCFSFNKKSWTNNIEIYAGAVYNQPFFKNKNSESSNYAHLRDSAEQYVLGVNAGFWYNPVHRSGIGVRTGLHASRWIENLSVTNAYEEYWDIKINQTKDPQGNVIKVDTTVTLKRGRRTQEWYNKFTALDIPLQIGFEYVKHKNTHFFFYGGAMFNVRMWAEGEIYNDKGKIISFPKQNIFNTQIGASLIGHFGIRKRITNHWWATGSIQSNYNLKDISTKDYTLSQKYLNIGAQIGLQYKF